jgi:hypothetical protein
MTRAELTSLGVNATDGSGATPAAQLELAIRSAWSCETSADGKSLRWLGTLEGRSLGESFQAAFSDFVRSLGIQPDLREALRTMPGGAASHRGRGAGRRRRRTTAATAGRRAAA